MIMLRALLHVAVYLLSCNCTRLPLYQGSSSIGERTLHESILLGFGKRKMFSASSGLITLRTLPCSHYMYTY